MKSAFAIAAAFAAFGANAQPQIQITPNIARTVVTFDVNSADPNAKVTGIHVEKTAAYCSVPSTDASPTRSEAGLDTIKTLNTPHWVVTCTRKSVITGSETIYLPFDIAFETSAGPVTITVPADAQFAYPSASNLQRQITATNQRFQKIRLQGIRSGKADAPPPPCESGYYDSGYTALFILPIGKKGQAHYSRVCISAPE